MKCQEIYPDCDLRRWEYVPSSIIADADLYYTKSEINEMLEEIVISGCVTSGEVQSMIDASIPENVSAFVNDVPYLTEHQSLSGYATEQWVEDKHYITSVDLSDYVTNEGLSAYTYDKETIDEKISSGGTFDPTQYYSTANTYNKTEINNLINSAKTEVEGEIPSLSGYATEQWVTNQGYLTEHQHLKTINNESLVGDGNIVISGGTSITVDPTLNSGSTNPVVNSAITIAINAKADKTEIPDVSNLQPKLTAGNNISINNNVISATDTKYTAGNGISISSANVISTIVDASLSSNSKNAVANSAITASLNTKAASSAVTDLQNTVNTVQNTVNTHTSNTSIHMTSGNVETQIVNHFWCGTEQQWSQISGSTQNNILYLVY